jgi:hypothetical protein
LTHSPVAVIHSPAETVAACPTAVTRSRFQRALSCRGTFDDQVVFLAEPTFLDVGVVFRPFALDPIEVGLYFLRCKQASDARQIEVVLWQIPDLQQRHQQNSTISRRQDNQKPPSAHSVIGFPEQPGTAQSKFRKIFVYSWGALPFSCISARRPFLERPEGSAHLVTWHLIHTIITLRG